MRRMLVGIALFSSLSVGVTVGAEQTKLSPAKRALLMKVAQKLAQWGQDPVLVNAVRAQNLRRVSVAELQRINAAWIAGGEDELAAAQMSGPCAARLQELTREGSYNESFLMDERGANVCITSRTSYYWRGQMPKFQKALNEGRGAIFIDEPKRDESAKAMLVQISVPVMDKGKAIGVLTVGVNADALGK